MAQNLATEPIPLEYKDDGSLRVVGTRVPLETIVHQFETGATPEEIVQDFTSLALADVYAILAYVLRHPEEIREYRVERRRAAAEIRQQYAGRTQQAGLRERLLARLPNGISHGLGDVEMAQPGIQGVDS